MLDFGDMLRAMDKLEANPGLNFCAMLVSKKSLTFNRGEADRVRR
jgi:hypothetical protein